MVLVGVWVLFRFTRIGRAMRAVADNPELAAVRGIGRRRVVTVVWALSGSLAALAGVLIGLRRDAGSADGLELHPALFTAAILGALASPMAAVAGALILAWPKNSPPPCSPRSIAQSWRSLVMAVILVGPPVRPFRRPVADAMTAYLVATLALVAISTIAGLALNMQWGLGGLVNFGLFGFYMLGAFIPAGCLPWAGWPPLVAMAAAIVVTAMASAAVSLISIRLSDDYLAIVSLGFAESLRLFISYEDWLTRGTLGVPGIVRPFTGWVAPAAADTVFLAFAVACLALVYVVLRDPSPLAVRPYATGHPEDPTVAQALGKETCSGYVYEPLVSVARRSASRQPARLQLHLHRSDPVWPL